MFSYGSGVTSTLFSLKYVHNNTQHNLVDS